MSGNSNIVPLRVPGFEDAEAVLNALPHPVLVISDTGTIEYANVAAEAFFDVGAVVLRRYALKEFVPHHSPLLTLIDQARTRGASVNEYQVDLGTPRTGQSRLVDIQVAPIIERPHDMLVVLQERSMAQKIDRQLTHRGAARSVSGMAGVLAHEIKNPLSGIRGAAQLLEASAEEDDRALTRLITDEADRICKLVDRMEVFGDDRPVDHAPINIHTVLDHVARIAKNGFAKHVSIIAEYDPSLPPVMANRDQLVQVFLNLLKNAAESIVEGSGKGEIVLTTAFRPGVRLSVPGAREKVSLPLEFCVRDNGPGVPRELLPHLFEPFVTTKSSGTGLGLALVAKIVGDHGGVIECDSGPGRTVFRVLMPKYEGALTSEGDDSEA